MPLEKAQKTSYLKELVDDGPLWGRLRVELRNSPKAESYRQKNL